MLGSIWMFNSMVQNPILSAFVCALMATLFWLYKRITALSKAGKKLGEERAKLHTEYAKLRAKRIQIQRSATEREEVVAELRTECDKLRTECDKLRAECDKRTAEYVELHAQNAKRTVEYVELRAQNAKLRTDLSEKAETFRCLMKETSIRNSALRSERDGLEVALRFTKELAEKLREKYKDVGT